MSVADAAPAPAAAPPRAPGVARRARARGDQLLLLLALDDVLRDRRADVYLLAFGFGFGSLVATVGGYDYVEFVGTGTVATAVLFSSAFAAIFGTFVKYKFQRTYDAMLAAPVDAEELVTAEALWIATRAGRLRLRAACSWRWSSASTRAWGMLLVPFIGFLAGLRLGRLRHPRRRRSRRRSRTSTTSSARASRRCSWSRARSSRSTELPDWAQTLAQLNPLYHCVQLVRHAAFGFEGWSDLGHVAALLVFALLMWRLAIWRLAQAPDRLRRRAVP